MHETIIQIYVQEIIPDLSNPDPLHSYLVHPHLCSCSDKSSYVVTLSANFSAGCLVLLTNSPEEDGQLSCMGIPTNSHHVYAFEINI
jgi:ribosomal protein S8E